MRYEIVRGQDINVLEERVQKRLDAGWALVGGVAVDREGVYQAMILEAA